MRYLRTRGVAARRISKAVQTAPAAEGGAQIALVSSNPAAIETQLNEQNPLSVQISQRVFQKGDSKVVDDLMSKGPGTYKVQIVGRYNAVTIDRIRPAGP